MLAKTKQAEYKHLPPKFKGPAVEATVEKRSNRLAEG
jgi:hypothetical protein